MRKVNISEIKPGERVEKSIYLNFGCLYLPQGAIVKVSVPWILKRYMCLPEIYVISL